MISNKKLLLSSIFPYVLMLIHDAWSISRFTSLFFSKSFIAVSQRQPLQQEVSLIIVQVSFTMT